VKRGRVHLIFLRSDALQAADYRFTYCALHMVISNFIYQIVNSPKL